MLLILTGSKKFRSPGHTIKKTKQGYGLYSCTSKYVPGGKPKSIQTYLGKITPDGFIPKSVVSKHPVYVEFGLSHFIISSFKRDLIRSSFRATDDTVYLGVVQYIFWKLSRYLLIFLLPYLQKTRNLYANIEILFLLHA